MVNGWVSGKASPENRAVIFAKYEEGRLQPYLS